MSKYEYTIGKDLDLRAEQEKTLATPVLPANALLRLMYWSFDVLFGKAVTLPKVKVLEVLARYPYWAWENGSYHRITRLCAHITFSSPQAIETALRHIRLGRESQDNEQWHLLLVEDLMRQRGMKQNFITMQMLPRLMALSYFMLTVVLYRIKPEWSFAMNAAFESHAEHEYMKMAVQNPAWDEEPIDSQYFGFYPRQKTLGDLIRRIALDERDHMNECLEELDRLAAP